MKLHNNEISASKVSDRDTKEFERMFRLYFLRLTKFAYKYVGNTAVSEDLTQSVFLKIWELNGKWNPPGTVRSYLYSSIKNQCLNHIKHAKVVAEWEAEDSAKPKYFHIKMDWDENERRAKLTEAIKLSLSKMPVKRREVFELSRDEGLTYSEIGDVLGITEKTVENHIGNALLFLKEELKDWI